MNNQQKRKAQQDAFPKHCSVCGKCYSDLKSFLEETRPLEKGEYSEGPRDSVLSYRNCPCGTTMTIKVDDLRDYSDEGIKQREEFKRRLKVYIDGGMEEKEAIKTVKKDLNLPE